jgi:hypothetical protein
MLPQHVDEMLRDYRTCLGRYSFLDVLIEELQDVEKLTEIDNRAEIINGKSSAMDGMPHGSTPGNPTERAGIALAAGYVSKELAELRSEISKLEAERSQNYKVVLFVDAWLKGLNRKERWIIERFFFDGMTYREINGLYRELYEEPCSKDSLRRLKNAAMSKIYDMAR